MTTRIFRWDDPNAPQLKATSGMSDMSLLPILDACLVDGYGDKTPLGWERTYTAMGKRVYRIPAGMSLRVEEGASYWVLRGVKVRGFDHMTDIDNGAGGFPNAALINNTNVINIAGENFTWVYAFNDGQVTIARRWAIIGDEKGIWVWIDSTAPTTYPDRFKFLFYFGEFPSEYSGDQYATILTGMDVASDYECGFSMTTMYGNVNYYSPTNGHTTSVSARKYDGVGDPVYTPLVAPILTSGPEYNSIGCFSTPHPLPPVAAKVYLHSVDVMDSTEGYTNSTSRTINIYRGKLPGIALLSQANVGQAFDEFLDDLGNRYLLLPVGNYYNSNKLIAVQTSNWR